MIKDFENYVKLNESKWGASEYKKAAKQIEDHIGELKDYLFTLLGVKPKLNVSVTPNGIHIESDNLLPLLKDKMWRCLYKEIIFETWGGGYNEYYYGDELYNRIWFTPKMKWKHATGGTNNGDFAGLDYICFKPDTNEWIYV